MMNQAVSVVRQVKRLGWVLIFSLALLASLFLPASANTDEVGEGLFVLEPARAPFHEKRSASSLSQFWQCEGLVNASLISSFHQLLSSFSSNLGIQPPMQAPCHYTTGYLEIFGSRVDTYGWRYYVSQQSMNDCVYRDHCTDFRSVNVMVKGGELKFQMMVTNLDRRLTEYMCMDTRGNLTQGHCE